MPDYNPLQYAEILLDGLLEYYPQAIRADAADLMYQQLLQEIPWQSSSIVLYGREHTIPRLQSWHGDPDTGYRYSGKTLTPLPWTPLLNQLRTWLNNEFSVNLNAVLCNLYRDGNDCMGWHADDEPELGMQPEIWSLSFGASRDFALRRIGSTRQSGLLLLQHGSLLTMKAGMQSHWQHSLPRRRGCTAPRINLTFRYVIPAQNRS